MTFLIEQTGKRENGEKELESINSTDKTKRKESENDAIDLHNCFPNEKCSSGLLSEFSNCKLLFCDDSRNSNFLHQWLIVEVKNNPKTRVGSTRKYLFPKIQLLLCLLFCCCHSSSFSFHYSFITHILISLYSWPHHCIVLILLIFLLFVLLLNDFFSFFLVNFCFSFSCCFVL